MPKDKSAPSRNRAKAPGPAKPAATPPRRTPRRMVRPVITHPRGHGDDGPAGPTEPYPYDPDPYRPGYDYSGEQPHGNRRDPVNQHRTGKELLGREPRARVAGRREALGEPAMAMLDEPEIHLSPVCQKYLAALQAPWSPEADGATVPTIPVVRSQKVGGFARTVMTIGTLGFGYAAATPHAICGAATSASVSILGYNRNDIYPGAAGAVTQELSYNLPYESADFGTAQGKVMGRPVAVGIRMRYIGEERLISGEIVAYEDPNHSTLASKTAADLLSQVGVQRAVVTNAREWVHIVSRPVNPNDLDYVSACSDTWALAICVTGATPGLTFEVEFYVRCEYIGTPTVNNATLTSADPYGFGIVMDATKWLSGHGSDDGRGITSRGSMHAMSAAISAVLSMGVTWIGDMVVGPGAGHLLASAASTFGSAFDGSSLWEDTGDVRDELRRRMLMPSTRPAFRVTSQPLLARLAVSPRQFHVASASFRRLDQRTLAIMARHARQRTVTDAPPVEPGVPTCRCPRNEPCTCTTWRLTERDLHDPTVEGTYPTNQTTETTK